MNVSVQRQQIDQATANRIGLPGSGDVLWIWGSGRYRSSDIYLAATTLESAINGTPRLRFFAGSRTELAWSGVEDDATPLFCNGSVGELSVRWNSFTQRWFATFNSQNPKGILLHHAPFPWGPWSRRPLRLFDPAHLNKKDPSGDPDPCSGDGLGNFMHKPRDPRDPPCDHVQDDMFKPGSFRNDEYGDAYGPYQISNYARDAGSGGTQIYFTMSTWNPYQVMLMTSILSPQDLQEE